MRLGANDSLGMTSGSWGYSPVFLNPTMIFLGVIDEFQDGIPEINFIQNSVTVGVVIFH